MSPWAWFFISVAAIIVVVWVTVWLMTRNIP